jgi:hypothetical protein
MILLLFPDQPTNSFSKTFFSGFGDDHHIQDAKEKTETAAANRRQKIFLQVKNDKNSNQDFIRYELPKHLDHKDLSDDDFPSQLIVKKWGSDSGGKELDPKIAMKKEAKFEFEKLQKFKEEKLLTHLDNESEQIINRNFTDSNNSSQSEILDIINQVQTKQLLDDFQNDIKISNLKDDLIIYKEQSLVDNDNKRVEKVKQIQYEEDAETNLKRKKISFYSNEITQRERHHRHKQGLNQFNERLLVDADKDKEINVSGNLNVKSITDDAVNDETINNEKSKKNDETRNKENDRTKNNKESNGNEETRNIEESKKNGETRNVEESKENGENNESVKSTESENVKEESKVKHFLNTCYKIMFFCFHKIFILSIFLKF